MTALQECMAEFTLFTKPIRCKMRQKQHYIIIWHQTIYQRFKRVNMKFCYFNGIVQKPNTEAGNDVEWQVNSETVVYRHLQLLY